MPAFYCLCACYQLVMAALVHGLFGIGIIAEMGAAVGPAEDVVFVVHLVVDLIEGQPVFHLALKTVEQRFRKTDEGGNGAAVPPTSVFFQQGNGQVAADTSRVSQDSFGFLT